MTYPYLAKLEAEYRSLRFRRKYTYDGQDLGVTCRKHRTEFALWSPLARSVTLMLYASSTDETPLEQIPMRKTPRGVWRHTECRSLHGTYYEYKIDHGYAELMAGDPYAVGCGSCSSRCMVVDLSLTDPEGWEEDCSPDRETEDIIWETHVKEFSWQPAGGFPEPLRGKYLAFTCPHTSLNDDGIHPTGLDYLRELGVNTVQLMPIFDYGSIHEEDPDQFNWGYDPVYYNIPEGSYSTDPGNGALRIRECKQMIQALHKAGFRVIMDVVYNHTHSLDSPFNRVVPGYYYRQDPEGHPANGSLCGNEIASEQPMVSRFIQQSVLYWAEEYHIDGFRFDLMGLLDVKLMNRLQKLLDQRFGAGEKFLYGEPWSGTAPSLPRRVYPASKANMGMLDPRIAMFCDNTRDSVKGNIFFSAQPGFVGGAENLEHSILNSVCGWQGSLPGISAPSQIISYLSCHDNLTLFDKLKASSPPDRDLMAMYRLAAAIELTCRGHIFMLSGEEFARTKEGNDNSYNAPIALNRLDWQRAYEYTELREYYRGLIALRKSCPGLCDKDPGTRVLDRWEQPGALGICLDNSGPRGTGRLCLIYNASLSPVTHKLPEGDWEICADGYSSLLWEDPPMDNDTVTCPPISAMILRKDD